MTYRGFMQARQFRFFWNLVAVQFAPEHGERCFVDKASLESSLKVGCPYQEKPDPFGPDEIYADTGWRMRGDIRNQTDAAIGAPEAS